MAGATRHTYKQELIKQITQSFRRSTLAVVPESCLRDMSTSSLAAFQEWLEPLLLERPALTPASHRLPGKHKKEG